MKKIYLTAILLVSTIFTFAQIITKDSSKVDSLRLKALAAAVATVNADYIPDVIPPSANAASLGKYGDIPVSYYVGLPNTPLNLYTIQSKDLSLPISLSYHHGGIKVEEEASNVGLGMSLNAGGLITRTIFGLDDLRNKGIPFHQIPAVPESDTYFKNNLADPLWGTPGVDTQPDIFYYNVGGQSGKFILASGTAFPLQGIPLDKSDVSITCKLLSTGSNPPTWGGSPQYQWEIITANGIKYTFTEQEISVSVSATSNLSPQFYINNPANLPAFDYNGVRSGHQITAWYLTQVYSSNTLSTISLNYDKDAPYYSTSRMSANEVYQKSFLDYQGSGCISPATLMTKNSGFHYSATMTRNAYLKSIVFDNGRVDFSLSDREDIQQYFPSGNGALSFPMSVSTGDIDDVSTYLLTAKKPQKIQSIAVKDAKGSLLKQFDFTYSYFNSGVVGTLPTNPTVGDYAKKYDNLRLRLEKVQESDNTGTNYLPAHQFRYVGDVYDATGTLTAGVVLPAKTSWAKDYYGYYNGKNNNNNSNYTHVIPSLAYPKMYGNKTFSGAYFFSNIGYSNTFDIGIDREVDSTYEAYGALSHIYYPTGGHTEFTYGFHKAMGGAGEVEASVYQATKDSTPPALVIPTGDNNLYTADLEFKLQCSFIPNTGSECLPTIPSNIASTWYAKIQSFGNVLISNNYSDWANKGCTTSGGATVCNFTYIANNMTMPTGTHQLSINPQTFSGQQLPTATAKMTYYKYHPSNYKEVVVGGLRIAKMTNFTDATTIAKTKVFSYTNSTGASTGKQLRPPVKFVYGYPEILRVQDEHSIYYTGQGWSAFCPVKNWEIEMNAFSLRPLGSSGSGNVIAYDQVSVSEVDGSNKPNGYSVYQYHNEADTFPSSLLFADIPSTPDLANGMLIHETILDKDKTIIEERIPSISLKTLDSSSYKGMLFLAGTSYTGTNLELAKGYYSIPAQFWYVSSETKRVYSGANYIETITNNSYGSSYHNLLTAQTFTDSKGNTISTQNAYPADRVASNNDPTGVYALMVNKHIINPIIETTSLFNGSQYARKLVNYQAWNSNAFFAPLSVQTQLKGTDPLITQVNFSAYDTRANLTQYSLRNGQKMALTWYGTTDVGKTDLLKTHTIGGGASGTVLSRSMSYDYKPLVGLLTATDINAYTLTNSYDGFSRLINVKDPQSFLLKDINYHYANQTTLTGLGLTPTNTLNYIISRVAREAQTGTTLSSTVENTTTNITYMDGLGKTLQSQIWKGSPDQTKDIITQTSLYNAYAIPYKNILITPSDVVTGAYKSNAESLASSFYGDSYPFSETVFELSPLNRPLKQYGAGQAWRTADKYLLYQYLLAGNGITSFDVGTNGTVTCNSSYPSSSLINDCVNSERGIQTYQLKDKQGRVTHKFQQLDAGFGVTAYVYDDANGGRLAYVIPPEAYKKLGPGLITSFTENDELFKEGMFGYHYDNVGGRLIEKHIPGGGWRYGIYGKNDVELMFADDADKANNYYQFRKVDALGREIMGGLINNIGAYSRSQIQTDFDSYAGQNYETTGSVLYGYTNTSIPPSYAPADASVKWVKYYDDYTFNTDANYNFNAANAFHAQGNIKGMLTGSLVRNLETNDWYKFINYYDYKGRIIQQFSQNHLGSIDRTDYQYRFNGEILKMRLAHRIGTPQEMTEIYEYTYDHLGRKTAFKHTLNGVLKNVAKYEYDEIGKLKTKRLSPSSSIGSVGSGSWNATTTWQNNNVPSIADNVTINTGHTVTINATETGSAGSLFDKGKLQNFGMLKLGVLIPSATVGDLYVETYQRHIRNGLKGINLDANGNLTNTLFSFKLAYEEDGIYYDGNIRNQYWKSNIDGIQRAYQYNYDNASRIKSAAYGSGKAGESYALNNVNYDDNGNITNLSRNGWKSNNTFGLVDNLNYSYNSNSNKILKVDDGSGETASFRDISGNDYSYNLDGSLNADANKGITLIEYNYLKLPKRVIQNGVTTLYQYTATGTKLKETIGSNYTDYSGNTIYKNNQLYQISHDEGRIINGEYEYDIKDHLGNLRVAFRDSLGVAKITQANSYGAWGEELPTLTYNKAIWKTDNFKFTGKESLQGTGFIDFGVRWYDNIVPRFTTIDPLSEISRRFSPYTYAFDNPLRFIDPDGMAAVGADGLTNEQWLAARGNAEQEGEFRNENREDEKEKNKKKEDKKTLPTVEQAQNSNGVNGLNPNGDGIEIDYTIESLYIGQKTFNALGKLWGSIFGVSSRFGALQYANKFGIDKYTSLRQALGSGSGLQVHHLIEQRFARILGQNANDMLSIVVTKAEHQIFTNGWRREIGYIFDKTSTITNNATRQDIEAAARKVYQNYPEIIKALGL